MKSMDKKVYDENWIRLKKACKIVKTENKFPNRLKISHLKREFNMENLKKIEPFGKKV